MQVKEEFYYEDMKEYLDENITLVIANPSREERKNKIYQEYVGTKNMLSITYDRKFCLVYLENTMSNLKMATFDELARVIRSFSNIELKNILIDITSLPHVVIACVLRTVLLELRPAKVFLSYVKPEKYLKENSEMYQFSAEFSAPAAIPGFASCSRSNEILVPFLGFEGVRLKNIIGDEHYSEINPIIGFPSDDPMWQFETLKHCKDAIVEQDAQLKIRKCSADSVYSAYFMLETIASDYRDKHMVLAPLGTRPHFVAAVIYALRHNRGSRLLYDNAKEKDSYTSGIRSIKIFHISRFIGV